MAYSLAMRAWLHAESCAMRKPTFRSPVRSSFLLLAGAIVAGALLGVFAPALAAQAKPLSDWFIDALRLLVKPVVFCTVAGAIAAMGNLRHLSLAGLKMMLYFEALAVLTLAAGMAGAYVFQPGAHWAAAQAPAVAAAPAATGLAQSYSLWQSLGAAFVHSPVLQVLLAAIACGIVLGTLGPRAARVHGLLQRGSAWLFTLVGWILQAAPLAALGATAWLVGHYGIGSIGPLVRLVLALYATTLLFVVLLLAIVGYCCGVRLWRLVAYLREELLIVFGTTSSLAAMPGLMEKMRRLGCAPAVTSIAIPAGYSFNLSGSNIYIALSLVFLAQLHQVVLDPMRCIAIMLVLLVTSKGASGVAGSAFVALTASLAILPEVSAETLACLVGIERLLKCRPLANVMGNVAGCIAVAAWCAQLDTRTLATELAAGPRPLPAR